MFKELNNIKVNFEVNHASRTKELNEAIESLKKTQKAKPSETTETKNSKKFKAMADLLASL